MTGLRSVIGQMFTFRRARETAAALRDPIGWPDGLPAGRTEIGPTVRWEDFDRRRIVGHWRGCFVGDVLTARMESGRTAVFKVVEREWHNDAEMFLATVRDVGYLSDDGTAAERDGETYPLPPRRRGYFV